MAWASGSWIQELNDVMRYIAEAPRHKLLAWGVLKEASEDRDCYDEEMGSCLEAVCRCFAGEHLFHNMLYNGRIDF